MSRKHISHTTVHSTKCIPATGPTSGSGNVHFSDILPSDPSSQLTARRLIARGRLGPDLDKVDYILHELVLVLWLSKH